MSSVSKEFPALLPMNSVFFFLNKGQNTDNKNVIGNCCNLQKKWRNEVKHSCQESWELVSLEQSSGCLDALHGQ